MSLNYVTLTVDVFDGQGNVPANGTATFTPSASLTDTTNHELIAQIPITVTFRPSGSPVVKLLATDNGTIAPSGWGWNVTFTGAGMPAAFSFFLLFASGASQNLSSISPTSSVVTMSAYLPIDYPTGATSGYVWTSTDNAGTGAWRASAGGTPSGNAGGDLGSTYPNPTVTATHLSAALPVAQGGTGSGTRNFAGLLTPTAVKTSAYNAAAGDFVPVDTTSGAVTVTLPTAPADLAVVGIKHVIQGGTNTVTFAAGGSDVFNKAGGPTSGTLTLVSQGVLLQYKSSTAIWYVFADDLPLTQLDSRYLQQSSLPLAIGSGGTGQATQQAALDALAGAVTNNQVLAGGGTHVTLRALAGADLPAATTSTQGAVILDGTAGDIQPVPGTQAAGNSTKAAAANHVHGRAVAAAAGFTPANPTATTSGSLVMMGLGTTVTYTPAATGTILIIASGVFFTATATTGGTIGGRYGTGTAPANAAAVTGTRFGNGDPAIRAANAVIGMNFVINAVVTGLTVSTAYWFDIALSTTNGSDAATITNVNFTIVELP